MVSQRARTTVTFPPTPPVPSPIGFGFQLVMATPLTTSKAASPLRSWPPIRLNRPPTNNRSPPQAKLNTAPSICVSHGRATPEFTSKAARLVRVAPPAWVKRPPTYTVSPTTSKLETPPFTALAHRKVSRLVRSSAAKPPRLAPLMRLNSPPTNNVSSPNASVLTTPSGFGWKSGSSWPVLKTCARLLRDWPPTSWKLPPMYQPPASSRMIAWTLDPQILGQRPSGAAV